MIYNPDLQPIRTKIFINKFYLVLRNSKIFFQKFKPKESKHTATMVRHFSFMDSIRPSVLHVVMSELWT